MKVAEFDIGEKDILAADAWLVQRSKDLDGDPLLITWKDRIIASVCAKAERPKAKKRKGEA